MDLVDNLTLQESLRPTHRENRDPWEHGDLGIDTGPNRNVETVHRGEEVAVRVDQTSLSKGEGVEGEKVSQLQGELELIEGIYDVCVADKHAPPLGAHLD